MSFKSASRMFMVVMMLLAIALQVSAQNTEVKMYVARNNNVATFYYDNLYDERTKNSGTSIIFIRESMPSPAYDVSRVIFDASFANARPTSTSGWFMRCDVLKEIIGIENLNTSNVANMSYMFGDCSGLTNLDVSHFDTSNVTDMQAMFSDCSGLTNLDVSHFNTSKVTDMGFMFSKCSGLTNLDVSHFDTRNVTDMHFMFNKCSSLTNLDVSKFNTENVTNMNAMFQECSGLTKLDVSHFDTKNVTDMSTMFSLCEALTSLDVSKFNTSNVVDVRCMFQTCEKLTSLDLSNFDTSNVTDMGYMFSGCKALTNLDISKFNTGNVTNMQSMFQRCRSLTNLNVSTFNTEKVTNMYLMFYDCKALISLDVSNFNTGNVTDMSSMFGGCASLTSLDVNTFNTSSVTNMNSMFNGCSNLINLDLSRFDTSNVTKMNNMFANCSSLVKLDVNNFNTSNVIEMRSMFSDCRALESLNVSNFDTGNVTDMATMFNNCSKLIHVNLSHFVTSNATVMDNMFGTFWGSSLESVSIGENMMQLPSFAGCRKLKKIVSYLKEPYAISGCFAKDVYENAKLYVPNDTRTLYTNTDGWKDFKHIVSKDIEPKDNENAGFGKDDIDENTDLDGNIVSNIFFNVPAEAGEYDAAENCIILKKATTDEQVKNIFGLDMFDEYLLNNFIGMIFMVDAGSGTIELEAETVGEMQLNVMVSTAEPITKQVSGKSKVSIPYDVAEPTLVYVYGSMPAAQSAKGIHKANAAENALKIYSMAWGKATGIRSAHSEKSSEAIIYNLNGQRVKTLGKGLYIVNGKKVILK